MAILEVTDLAPFADIDEAKAQAMIADAVAMATMAAPCLAGTLTPIQAAAAKAILRGAVLRWNDSGSTAQPAMVAGPFQITPQNQPRKSLFWPSEISELQKICATGGGAFSVDTAASPMVFHSVLCGFGGDGCTCGIAGFDAATIGAPVDPGPIDGGTP